MAEESDQLNDELPSYTFDALISDIGGAMGLLLGLSILDLCVFSSNVIRGLVTFKRKMVI